MKYLCLLLVLLPISIVATAAPVIHAISNIKDEKVIINVNYKTQSLLQLNLNSKKVEHILIPKDLSQNEILGAILLTNNVLLFSQNTMGGAGQNLKLSTYNSVAKKWTIDQTIDCESFDTVDIHKHKLTLHCDANPLKNKASRSIDIPFHTLATKSLKVVFPITNQQSEVVFYRLEGPMMNWHKIYFGVNGSKEISLTAEDLLQSK